MPQRADAVRTEGSSSVKAGGAWRGGVPPGATRHRVTRVRGGVRRQQVRVDSRGLPGGSTRASATSSSRAPPSSWQGDWGGGETHRPGGAGGQDPPQGPELREAVPTPGMRGWATRAGEEWLQPPGLQRSPTWRPAARRDLDDLNSPSKTPGARIGKARLAGLRESSFFGTWPLVDLRSTPLPCGGGAGPGKRPRGSS